MRKNGKCSICGADSRLNGVDMLFCPECKRKFPDTTRENKIHPRDLDGIPDMKKFCNSLLIYED